MSRSAISSYHRKAELPNQDLQPVGLIQTQWTAYKCEEKSPRTPLALRSMAFWGSRFALFHVADGQ